MHKRNRYYRGNQIDFGALAEFRPSLKQYLIQKSSSGGTKSGKEEAKKTEETVKANGKEQASITEESVKASENEQTSETEETVTASGEEQTSKTEETVKASSTKTKPFYTLNFSDPLALRELTYAILEKDFGLKLEIPEGVLVPTLPQKINYLHWIEDLLVPVGLGKNKDSVPKGESTIGIDIGTGTSCIYPLLGHKMNGWSFVATDINEDTVEVAKNNVNINNLEEYIEVMQVAEDTILDEVIGPEETVYSFTVCNPPFFKSKEDKLGEESSRSASRPAPSTVSTGTDEETITKGGEVEFVKRIIKDSLKFREKVKWYTSMLGKKNSVKKIMTELQKNEVPVMMSTELKQGKTWRWGVAWSFDTAMKDKVEELQPSKKRRRPSDEVLRLIVRGLGYCAPPPTPEGVQEVRQWIEKELDELQIDRILECSSKLGEGHSAKCVSSSDLTKSVQYQCHAHKATWPHQRKRQRVQKKLADLSSLIAISKEKSEGEEPTENSAALKELLKGLETELEVLSPACNLQFVCTITIAKPEKSSGPLKKKKKKSAKKEKTDESDQDKEMVVVELEWKGDSDRDKLHQILQYLSNKMNTTEFAK